MTDDLVKRLENVRCDGVEELCWEAADRIEQLEVKLSKAMQHVADYSNDPHLVEWALTTLAELKV